MPGLSLEHRYRLIREAERAAIEGRGLTPADARVLRALAFDFHNGATGRTDPGYRAIARRARCALGTVSASVHRLAAAGFLAFERRLLRVAGRWLRWTHAYTLAAGPPRSGVGAEPVKVSRKGAPERPAAPSVAQQIATVRAWQAEWEARRG